MSYVECMVLGLLYRGCRYGHEIDKAIEERNMRLWSKITRVSMYKALARIKEKGWAQTSIEKEGKLPERTVYTLTDAGIEALKNMVSEGLASNEIIDFRISIPVSFMSMLPPLEAINQLNKRKKMVLELLEDIQATTEEDNPFLGKIANRKLIRGYYNMELEWIEWLILELKKREV